MNPLVQRKTTCAKEEEAKQVNDDDDCDDQRSTLAFPKKNRVDGENNNFTNGHHAIAPACTSQRQPQQAMPWLGEKKGNKSLVYRFGFRQDRFADSRILCL
jgi:hypothetical protein